MSEVKVKVSVVMITYAHEKFIEQAINGILSQKCDFNVELIIANDHSPDSTGDKIKSLVENKFPENFSINYVDRDKNWGMMPNFIDALSKASGRYIALCEGDDYWTDPLKLQKQVEFLESNQNYSICFHAVDVKYENGIVPFFKNINKDTKETTILQDLLQQNFIHTPSVVFRNNMDYPEWLVHAYPGDWPLHIINATYGKIKFLKDKMAVYRVHYGGVHSTTGGQIEKTFKTFKNIITELEKRGLINEFQFAVNEYKKSYARYYGFDRSPNVNFNRFKKSSLLIDSGSTRLKLLFWLPLLFDNYSNKILKAILGLKRKVTR